ncbi:MAG: acyl-CoA/acyl-ACP dehydrogenase [Deltaproteobacteria bacterium]|nr:acyl-CoA/acyl-ACP dehydrogenase [Deltaproteobacteria bacterium]
MDFTFSEDQDAVRELARQILGDACKPEHLAAIEREAEGDGLDHDLWRSLAGANLLGVAVPEKQGGSDLGLAALFALLEEAGRALAPVPLLETLVYAALPIGEFGTDAQKDRWLSGVVSGETLLTAALHEVGSSDAANPGVTAKPEGDHWILSGQKSCVPLGDLAARILVPAATGDGQIGVFLVDPKSAGVQLEAGLANNFERQYVLALDGVKVGPDDVLGDPAAGAEIVNWLVVRARTAIAAIELGVCDAALRMTAEYTATRKQFGRPIGTFQAVTMRAADSFVDLECMKSTLWQAAWRLEEGLPAASYVNAAKWWACRGGNRVVHTAMHLHAGTGADIDYPVHRYFLWSKHLELLLGGAGRQLAEIGAAAAAEA